MREKYSTCVFCGWNPSLDLWYLSLAIVMMITLHKTFHSIILNCAFKKFFDIFIYNQTWAHNQLVNVCAWAVLWAKKEEKQKQRNTFSIYAFVDVIIEPTPVRYLSLKNYFALPKIKFVILRQIRAGMNCVNWNSRTHTKIGSEYKYLLIKEMSMISTASKRA